MHVHFDLWCQDRRSSCCKGGKMPINQVSLNGFCLALDNNHASVAASLCSQLPEVDPKSSACVPSLTLWRGSVCLFWVSISSFVKWENYRAPSSSNILHTQKQAVNSAKFVALFPHSLSTSGRGLLFALEVPQVLYSASNSTHQLSGIYALLSSEWFAYIILFHLYYSTWTSDERPEAQRG